MLEGQTAPGCSELFFSEMINAEYAEAGGRIGLLRISTRDGRPFEVAARPDVAERVLDAVREGKQPAGVAAPSSAQAIWTERPSDGPEPGPQGEPPEGQKTCPMCAEHVKAAARICRFCRHEFE